MRVFPNPMEENTTLKVEVLNRNDFKKGEVFFSVFSLSGKQLLYFELPAHRSTLVVNKNDLPAGIYLYQVNTNQSGTIAKGKLVIH